MLRNSLPEKNRKDTLYKKVKYKEQEEEWIVMVNLNEEILQALTEKMSSLYVSYRKRFVLSIPGASMFTPKRKNGEFISKSWCTCAPIMESVWMHWRKKSDAPFHVFRERHASYSTIAVWATPFRNSSRSHGLIRNPEKSIRRGRWTTSGRLSTTPCPSCAASRPAHRLTSSWCPACAWHRSSVPSSCRSVRGTPTA